MYSMFTPVTVPIVRTSPSYGFNPRYYRYEPMQTNVMIGTLPNDFLRVPGYVVQSQEEQDRAAAIHLQNQIIAQSRQTVVGRLEVTILTASLNKNYGLTRMDPYVRLRIGRHVYETPTAHNGAKSPSWNKTFQVYNLKKEENLMHIEVYDENTLSEDERIAWTFVDIPEIVYKGEPVDEWYKLSGKLGEEREGVIHINIAYTTGPAPMAPNVMVLPGYSTAVSPVPIYTMPPAVPQPYAATEPIPYGVAQTHPYPQRTPPEIRPEDITQLQEMFPKIDEEVIASVLEASNGNKEFAINSLLQME